MPVTASAPGKVILFGEHAVVYGEPAIAFAIDKRIYVTVDRRADERICISSAPEIVDGYPYVKKAVELTFEYCSEKCGLDLKIESEFPPASGLGSSASVSVSTILATSTLLNVDIEKKDIARLGHRVEKKIQGAASITDSSVTTYGGVLFVKPKLETVEEILVDELPFVVGYTGKGGATGQLVRKVRESRDKSPEIFDPIIQTIGRITIRAKNVLEDGGDIGELMNINHGLLEALGVGTESLSRYVHSARDAGALGAKITGAGGGGCMIAFAPDNQDEVARAIEQQGGLALRVKSEEQGARIELGR
jgi:mevalonate kinase